MEHVVFWTYVAGMALFILWIAASEMGWTYRRLVRLDRWTNHNLFNGWKGETVSRRGGRVLARRAEGNKEDGDAVWCILCKLLDLLDRNHCAKAYSSWLEADAESDSRHT